MPPHTPATRRSASDRISRRRSPAGWTVVPQKRQYRESTSISLAQRLHVIGSPPARPPTKVDERIAPRVHRDHDETDHHLRLPRQPFRIEHREEVARHEIAGVEV